LRIGRDNGAIAGRAERSISPSEIALSHLTSIPPTHLSSSMELSPAETGRSSQSRRPSFLSLSLSLSLCSQTAAPDFAADCKIIQGARYGRRVVAHTAPNLRLQAAVCESAAMERKWNDREARMVIIVRELTRDCWGNRNKPRRFAGLAGRPAGRQRPRCSLNARCHVT